MALALIGPACSRSGYVAGADQGAPPDSALPEVDITPSTDAFRPQDANEGIVSDHSCLGCGGGPCCTYGTGGWVLGPVELVANINSSAGEVDLFVYQDCKTIAFSSTRGGQADVFIAVRPEASAPFGAPTPVVWLNTAAHEYSYVETADGLELLLAIGATFSDADIYRARRSTPAIPWSDTMLRLDPALSTSGADFDLALSADGLRLYLAPHPSAGVPYLASASRPSLDADFSAPQPIPGFEACYDPTLTADERVMIYAAARSAEESDLDLWYVVRADRDQPFGLSQRLPEVNSMHLDSEPTLSPDGCELFFASDRPGGLGQKDLYRVQVIAGP